MQSDLDHRPNMDAFIPKYKTKMQTIPWAAQDANMTIQDETLMPAGKQQERIRVLITRNDLAYKPHFDQKPLKSRVSGN